MKTPKPTTTAKTDPAKPAPAAAPAPAPAVPIKVPPLFRKVDWLALLIAFGAIWITYFLTLAPEQTLEDSGELCTGAFYAGIPHPPGYPFWAIYSWIWTKILPIGNVAWRVEVGEATAAAMACGLVAFMVSRGSSMLVEGIEELRSIAGKWENAICLTSGVVAGLMLGFGGTMWSESVAINRISLFGVPWVCIVLLCLMRWIYAPHQRRYLFFAMFFFGICATIHQTLLVAAIAIEVTVAVVQPRLGRNLFLWNSIIYLGGLAAQSGHYTTMLDTAFMVLLIYHVVGICSIAAFAWLSLATKEDITGPGRDLLMAVLISAPAFFFMLGVKGVGLFLLFLVVFGTLVYLAVKTRHMGWEWLVTIGLGWVWVAGASFYFYEAIAGMTDPPMQWGYPRTVEGFFHALSRGQYEKASPSNPFADPSRFIMQLGLLIRHIAEEYNWVCFLFILLPFFFIFRMKKRERCWIISIGSMYLCVGGLLVILMNPSIDRQSSDLIKVFFTSSHAVLAVLMGYGITLIASYMATHYERFRQWGLVGGAITAVVALYTLWDIACKHYFGPAGFFGPAGPSSILDVPRRIFGAFGSNQGGLPIYGCTILLALPFIFIVALLAYRSRAPLAITLGLFAIMPLYSGLSHWGSSEQRNHWFGYWFGHDMFSPPFVGPDGKLTYDSKLREQALKGPNGALVYPEMTPNTILYGGTDPGRFCPTYMIFCDSFLPPSCEPASDPTFDRRDVYLITQNARADNTYLDYLRAQYYRSQQQDPPFFSELARNVLKDKPYETNLLARLMSPLDWYFEARGARVEKRWRTYTSWFSGSDFTNLPALTACLKPSEKQDPLSQWLFQNLSKPTQDLLTGQSDEPRLREALAQDFNVLLERELKQKQALTAKQNEKDSVDQQIAEGDSSDKLRQRQADLAKEVAAIKVEPLYQPARFAQVQITDYLRKFIEQNPQSDTRIRLNRLLLEAAYPNSIPRSLGGVYPDREIYIASAEDSQECFQQYMKDAEQRIRHDQEFPNEPRQVKPGEDVHIVRDEYGQQKVQVSGQIAVMSINGLLTKVIFDHNPDNDFYVEESFPLDWMYPHLTPFGIIMKINRQPLHEVTPDIIKRDHEFWCKYSERLIGNWITYDTSVQDIVHFIERVYLRRDYNGFTGDRKFVRDEQAQKSFSKLRSSIGGIYAWRVTDPNNGDPAVRLRMIKEADFAFRQAFAYCPYSPEAVFRYVNLLLMQNRLDDAVLVARTCRKLDPFNDQMTDLVSRLEGFKNAQAAQAGGAAQLTQLEKEVDSDPTSYQKVFDLASRYTQMQQTDRAADLLVRTLKEPQTPDSVVLAIVRADEDLNRPARLQSALDDLLGRARISADVVLAIAKSYADGNQPQKLETALKKLVQVAPDEPEHWFDLASCHATLGRPGDALQDLRQAMKLNAQRLARDPKALDLRTKLADGRFAALSTNPEFRAFSK